MPLFLVVALQDSGPAVDQAIESRYPGVSFKIEPGKWVVSAADVTIAKELAINLGIRDTESHLIIPIRGYTGRANPDLWEWMAAQSDKVNA